MTRAGPGDPGSIEPSIDSSILAFLRVVPRYLELRLTPQEELAIDDALAAQGIELAESIRWREPGTDAYDLELGAGVLAPLAKTVLGREAEVIVRVEGLAPFDFASFAASATLEAVLPRLPSFLPGLPGPYRFFGSDEARPPFLWASHEAAGLHVVGVLHEPRWRTWAAAFERATATWPRRL